MSGHRTLLAYGINTGGTVHAETDNPALLALLRKNSTDHIAQPSSSASDTAHAVAVADLLSLSCHSAQNDGKDSDQVLKSASCAEVSGSGSHSDQQLEESLPADPTKPFSAIVASQSLVNHSVQKVISGNKDEVPTVEAVSLTSTVRDIPSETDSASSELLALAGTSRKSCVLSASASESEETDDENVDNDDADSAVKNINALTIRLNQTNVQNSFYPDKRSPEREPSGSHTTATSAVSPAPSASITSINNASSTFPSSGLSFPDLSNPSHQRFVTPYASRRLKDNPEGGGTSISIALTDEYGTKTLLKVPKDPSWSVIQATRLRARSGDGRESGSKIHASLTSAQHSEGIVKPADSLDITETREPLEHLNPVQHITVLSPSKEVGVGRPASQPAAPSAEQGLTSKPAAFSRTDLPSQSSLTQPNTKVAAKDQTAFLVRGEATADSVGTSPTSILKKSKGSEHGPAVSSVRRVYVESPSFTQEEEEEYRFVSCHIDEDGDPDTDHPTYRGLDKLAVNTMESEARQMRKPIKQVRYEDNKDRYEDREEILPFYEVADTPQQKQYVLKSKTGSAHAVNKSVPPQPVKSLTLPTGPSYDPLDEEDLKRETSYQQQLKNRVESIQRSAEQTIIPRLPLRPDSEEFHDSLDIPEDVELDSERLTHHRNSMDVYEQQRLHQAMQNAQWRNPPIPPQNFASHHHQQQGYSNLHRQGNVDSQSQEFDDPERQDFAALQRRYADSLKQGFEEPRRWENVDPQSRAYGNPLSQERNYDPYYLEQQNVFHGQYNAAANQPQLVRGNSQNLRQAPIPLHQPQFNSQAYNSQRLPWINARIQGQQQSSPYERNDHTQHGYHPFTAEPHDGYYLTEPQSYTDEPEPIYNQGYEANADNKSQAYYAEGDQGLDSDRYVLEDLSQRHAANEDMEPSKPIYDYVSHNKMDYGRPKRRTYMKIHDVRKEEEEKLNHIFIQPKVKSKGKKGNQDNSPPSYQMIEENPNEDMGHAAEELWAQRSAYLAHAKNSQIIGGKRKPGSNMSMLGNSNRRMYHSDSSIPSSTQPMRQPLQPIASNQMQIVPASQTLAQISPAHSPPYHYSTDFKPISQQVITEDGQRISVDVNLRLISPPLGMDPETDQSLGHQPFGNYRQTGLQYPLENITNGQQHLIGDENGFSPARYSADDVLYGGGPAVDGNPGGYVSDTNHDYSNPVYTTNPYKKIPPIPVNSEGLPRSAPVQLEGSYMQSYLAEKEKAQKMGNKPWYRVYNLKDYKRMQNEVRLGTRTLGPDLDNDTYKERREKMMRQMDYAKAVKDKNTKELINRKPPAFPRIKEQDDMLNKRKLAVEYAKNVPKPTVKPRPMPFNSYEVASKLSPIAKSSHNQQFSQPESSVEVLDLQKLHERHEQDKISAELIRQNAHGIMS